MKMTYTTCASCAYTTYTTLEPTGHEYVNDYCTKCEGHISADGLIFVSNRDGTCYVMMGEFLGGDLIIPSRSPSGDVVTGIGRRAFYECESLTGVVIPDCVTTMGDRAFYRCINLSSVTIGSGITEISNRGFYKCSSLTEITIPDNVTAIRAYAFINCIALESVTIGDGVETLEADVFYNCYSLKTVRLGEKVNFIGYYAFYYCSALTDVYYGVDEYDAKNISINKSNKLFLKATAHYTEHEHNIVYIEALAPTCREAGYEAYFGCEVC